MIKEAKPVLQELDEAECLRLVSPGGVGRIASAAGAAVATFRITAREDAEIARQARGVLRREAGRRP